MPGRIIVESVAQFRGRRSAPLVVLTLYPISSDIFSCQDTYGWPEEVRVWAPAQTLRSVVITDGQVVAVPLVVGSSPTIAFFILTGNGLIGVVTGSAYSSTIPTGFVMAQAPSAGTLVTLGSTVNLTLSLGTQRVLLVEALTVGSYKGVPHQPGDKFYLN